ncbi:MAG: RHS repeat-associated core domain-containing protein [Asticcacaulis sp.]
MRFLFAAAPVAKSAEIGGNLLKPGPFAKDSIPATSSSATVAERQQVTQIGQTSGCHSCGTTNPGTKSGDFVPDHQPPTKLNPEGRLARYTSVDGSGTHVTEFAYDGSDLIAEYAGGTTTVLRSYVHGPGADEPVVWFEGSGFTAKHFLAPNYQSSLIATADAGGNLETTYEYGPYGEPEIDRANPATVNPWTDPRFRYTGQTMLFGARLYDYKARVYDPVYGHFLQTDPIGSKDDLDLYAYVKDDPVNGSDPTGMVSPKPGLGAPEVIGESEEMAEAPKAGEGKPVELKSTDTGFEPVAEEASQDLIKVVDQAKEAIGQTLKELAEAGKTFEDNVGQSLGLTLNTRTFKPEGEKATIPDYNDGKNIGDAKAVKYQANTAQMRSQQQLAKDQGGDHTIYVRQDTKISKPLNDSPTKIVRCNPDGTCS